MGDDAATVEQLRAELRQAETRSTARCAESAALRQELAEALEQQTATAEILRGIAHSPTDASPSSTRSLETAGRLSNSTDVWLCHQGGRPAPRRRGVRRLHPSHSRRRPPDAHPGRVNSRALQSRRTIHVADSSDPTFRARFPGTGYPDGIAFLTVPLVREDEASGLLTVARDRAHPYTPREIALLETFADQAVIAIENARLFEELERRNAALEA